MAAWFQAGGGERRLKNLSPGYMGRGVATGASRTTPLEDTAASSLNIPQRQSSWLRETS